MSSKEIPLSIVLRAVDDATADLRKIRRELDKTAKPVKGLRAQFKALGKTGLGNLRKSLKGATRGAKGLAMGLGGLVGAAGIASLGKDALSFEDGLQRVGSQARFSAGEIGNLRKMLDEASDSSGIARDSLLGGISAVVDLQGGAAATKSNIDTMTKALLGTGAAAEDVAGLMFALKSNMDIDDKDMLGALSVIDRIGAEKSIPFSELSSQLSTITGKAMDFGLTGTKGVSQLVAAMQVLRESFGGAAEVTTGLGGAMTAFLKKETQLRDLGVEVRDTEGNLRNLFDIIEDIGNNKKIQKKGLINVLGRAEATTAVGKIAKKLQEVRDLADLGASNTDFLNVRSAERMNSSIGRIDKSLNRAKQTMLTLFTAERIDKFAEGVKKLADTLSYLVGHAKEVVAVIGAIKVGGMISSLSAAGGSLGKFAGGLGGAVAGLAAFYAGLRIAAEWLDNKQDESIKEKVESSSAKRHLVGSLSNRSIAGLAYAKRTGILQKGGGINRGLLKKHGFNDKEIAKAISTIRSGQARKKAQDRAKIQIEITGAPAGTRVTTDPRSTADVDLSTGYQMVPS